ncbi:reprolysin-like metallopeptidase [Methylolobus aquaticus]
MHDSAYRHSVRSGRRRTGANRSLLLAGVLVALIPVAHAQRPAPPPKSEADGALDLRYQDATLADLARDAQQLGGIAITVPAALKRDVLKRDVRAASWADGLADLLGDYNYIAVRSPAGRLERIVIQARQNPNARPQAAVKPPMGTGAALFEVDASALNKPVPKALASLTPHAITPIKLSVERLASMKPGDTLSVRLGDRAYKLVHDHAQRHDTGDTSWIAYVEQDGTAFRAVLTYRADGALTGQINTARGLFQIIQFDEKTWVIDIKASGLGAGSLDEDQRSFPTGGGKATAAVADGRPATAQSRATVDLMVLYTHEPGPHPVMRASHLTAVTQQAFTDSGAFVNLRLVRTERVDYTDNNANFAALQDLTRNRIGTDVHALRSRYGADIVVLLRPFHSSAQGSCGVSWIGGSNGLPLTPAAGFAVVSDGFDDRYFCHEYTFAHELGHAFGNVHDADLSPPGIFPFSYAWAVPGKFATIMSYLFDVAPLVGKFANPAVACTDKGLPCGRKDIADNARTINLTAPIIAGFMPTAAD